MTCIGVSGAFARWNLACVSLLVAVMSFPASAAPLQSMRPYREALLERNLGQYDASILYRGRFGPLDAAIRSDASLAVYPQDGTSVITIAPKRAKGSPSFEAVEPSEYRTHYFRAGKETSIADVPHFGRVIAHEVYPGIDLAVHAGERRLEFDFVVAPRADPGRIALVIGGAESVTLERGCVLHAFSKVLDNHFHPVSGNRHERPQSTSVVIGEEAVIGERAIVLPGARLEAGVQLEAGVVIARRVPRGTVLAGYPPRPVRKREPA